MVTKETGATPNGDFLHFPALTVRKGQIYSNLSRDRTCFHQLGACERECFRLAGILITIGNLRQELLETLAASKYSILLSRVVTLQAPIFQVLAFDSESIISDGAQPPGYAISLISNINKRPVYGFSYVGHQAVSGFVVFLYLGCVSCKWVTSGCIKLSFSTLQFFRHGGGSGSQRRAGCTVGRRKSSLCGGSTSGWEIHT